MGKRIVIVGAGALGAYVGGHLARAGEDVTLIDPWPAHVEQMRAEGLSLKGLSEEECFSTPVHCRGTPCNSFSFSCWCDPNEIIFLWTFS